MQNFWGGMSIPLRSLCVIRLGSSLRERIINKIYSRRGGRLLLEKPGLYRNVIVVFLQDEFEVLVIISSIGRAPVLKVRIKTKYVR